MSNTHRLQPDPPHMIQPEGCNYTPDEVGRMLANRVVQPHYAAWLVRKAIATAQRCTADTIAAQAAELEGVRKDAELGRYIRLTAAQRAHGLSEEAFSIRVENAIKRRASFDTAIADSGAGGGA